MAKSYSTKQLDIILEALANQHRRDIVYTLSLQPTSISRLASMQGLSLPAIHKHIKILDHAGIILRKKTGRIVFLTLNRKSLYTLQQWLTQYQAYWGTDAERLSNYTEYLKQERR